MLRLMRSGHIEIDLLRRQLHYYQGNFLAGSYPIAIGKPATPSPVGEWSIINKKILNYDSVFGSRWMGLDNPGYGIHGTNNPSSIGNAVSNGCIRMYNHNVEELFSKVGIGTRVYIHQGNNNYQHNYEYNYENNYEYNEYNDYNVTPINPSPTPIYKPAERTYQIKSGDTLWSISQKINVPLNELIKINPNVNPNNLMVEQTINLP
jgi:LysM repeat protein